MRRRDRVHHPQNGPGTRSCCPVDREANRHPTAIGEDAALGANLAAVRGVLARLFPPERGFGPRLIHREPGPVHTVSGVIFHDALFPQGHEDVRLRPRLQTAMGRPTGTDARLVRRMPLAARAEHEKDGLHRLSIIDARPLAPQRVRFARGDQGHAPTTRPGYASHGRLSRGRQALVRLLCGGRQRLQHLADGRTQILAKGRCQPCLDTCLGNPRQHLRHSTRVPAYLTRLRFQGQEAGPEPCQRHKDGPASWASRAAIRCARFSSLAESSRPAPRDLPPFALYRTI